MLYTLYYIYIYIYIYKVTLGPMLCSARPLVQDVCSLASLEMRAFFCRSCLRVGALVAITPPLRALFCAGASAPPRRNPCVQPMYIAKN